MNCSNDYIAVFDSGVGGISVLRHLHRLMPEERFLYYGDSANAPYGTRSVSEIRTLTLQAVEKLYRRPIKALVLACNTATAAAIGTLREQYPQQIIVGIEPALKQAAEHFPNGTVGVMATPTTLKEEKFSLLMDRFGRHCHVVKLAAPGLPELVEAGKANSPESETLLRPLLCPWAGKLDGIVLGCTHYPFAKDTIIRLLGRNTAVFDGGEGTARETRRRLELAGLLRRGTGEILLENSSDDFHIPALCQKLLELPFY